MRTSNFRMPAGQPVGRTYPRARVAAAFRGSHEPTFNRRMGVRVVLHAPGLHGPARVRVNGNEVGHILWPPYTCDITDAWKPGALTIEIELAGDLRSLLQTDFDSRVGLVEPPVIRIMTPSGTSEPGSPAAPGSGDRKRS